VNHVSALARCDSPTAFNVHLATVTRSGLMATADFSFKRLTHSHNGIYSDDVARSSTTSDVFNAIAEAHRREILDVLINGEKAVGAIVQDLSMSQPQVSKHLRVLSEVGLVRCRAEGRRRLYRLETEKLRPLHAWLAQYEQTWKERLDRMDDYLKDIQQKGEQQ
jgi:DNA-binding transcriptional ArsR family regulator